MTTRPPLIFLPGLLCDAVLWQHQVHHLTEVAQPQVITLTHEDSITAMAAQVLEQAPPKFALAGLSMGGYVAQEIMRREPHRVVKLALINTQARADSEQTKERRHGLIALAKTGKFKGVTPKLLPLLIHGERLHDAALTEPILKMAERVGRDAFIRQQTAILNRSDSRPSLGKVSCPTLIIAGRQDALTPLELAQEMHSLIPSSQLALIEECGHLSPLERPQAVTALLRLWL